MYVVYGQTNGESVNRKCGIKCSTQTIARTLTNIQQITSSIWVIISSMLDYGQTTQQARIPIRHSNTCTTSIQIVFNEVN